MKLETEYAIQVLHVAMKFKYWSRKLAINYSILIIRFHSADYSATLGTDVDLQCLGISALLAERTSLGL